MILIWTLLNNGLLMFFIVISYKATKIIRVNIGLFASFIFVLGLLSFMVNSNIENDKNEPNFSPIKCWKLVTDDSLKRNETYILNIDMENTFISKYKLGIKYCKDNSGQKIIPIEAFTSTTGFCCGTYWKPKSVIFNRTIDNNKLRYIVNGVVEWKLFSSTIFYQYKNYTGIVFTKDAIIRRGQLQ